MQLEGLPEKTVPGSSQNRASQKINSQTQQSKVWQDKSYPIGGGAAARKKLCQGAPNTELAKKQTPKRQQSEVWQDKSYPMLGDMILTLGSMVVDHNGQPWVHSSRESHERRAEVEEHVAAWVHSPRGSHERRAEVAEHVAAREGLAILGSPAFTSRWL